MPSSLPSPRRAVVRRTAAIAALAAAGALLTGCTAIPVALDIASGTSERSFETHADAVGNWGVDGIPAFIPADAERLHHRASTGRTEEIIVYRSETPPAGECVEEPRDSRPAITADWAPEKLDDTVTRCGEWQIQQVGERWHAWRADPEPSAASR